MMHGDEFLKRMEAGDPGVWDDLMPMLHHIVLGACNNLRVNDSSKDDIVQDVAIRVFTHWQSFSAQSALSTWIYAIARNRCLDEFRKRKVRGENHSHLPGDNTSISSPNEPSYDAKFELMLCVQQLLAELESQPPARHGSKRMIDVLQFWIEHSPTTEELAEFLQTTPQAAKQRKYEIRKYIETLYEKFCGHEDC